MDTLEKVRLLKILRKYLGQSLDYGELDCNLLVLEMYKPEAYEKLRGRYTTVIGGARVANKEFGFISIKDFCAATYQEIDKSFVLPLDIVVFEGHDVAVWTQDGIFCVQEDKTFGYQKLPNDADYKIYRKV